ncbi:MAG: RNA-binding domain-containing protein [Bacilli bacterium]
MKPITEEQLREFLRMPHETEWLEFKTDWFQSNQLGEYISAISNSASMNGKKEGFMIWGVDNDSHDIVGTEFDFRVDVNKNEPLEHFLARQLSPSIAFRFEETAVENKRIVILRIPAAIKVPTSYEKERWLRIGSSKVNLSKYPEREANFWEVLKQGLPTMANTPSEYQNLTFNKLFSYCDNKGHPLNKDTYKDNLHLLTDDGQHNLVAKLLADNGHVSIKAGLFRGTSKADTLYSVKEFGNTCLFISADSILEYGDIINILQADEVHRVAGRKEIPLFDSSAYREAVLNALIHNKWVSGDAPMFEFFSDRIEIRSFGPMPPNQTSSGFFRGNSKPVNKELSEAFSTLGISDRLGRGVPKIVHAYGEQAFSFEEDSILVTIPFSVLEDKQDNINEFDERLELKMDELKLNQSQKIIIKSMFENRNVSIFGLMEKTGLGKTGVIKSIKILKEKGLVIRTGTARVGYWSVKIQVNQ